MNCMQWDELHKLTNREIVELMEKEKSLDDLKDIQSEIAYRFQLMLEEGQLDPDWIMADYLPKF